MWLFVRLAEAGIRADLEAASAGSPDLAVACTSAGAAARQFGRMVTALEGDGTLPGLAQPGPMGVLLGDEQRLTLSLWRGTGALRVGLETAWSAEQVARLLALPAGREVREGPEGWSVVDERGAELRVSASGGWAQVSRGDPPKDRTRLVPRRLSEALPELPGCAMLAHIVDAEIGALDAGVHLPLGDAEEATFALALPATEGLTGVLFTPGTPGEIRSAAAPEGLVVLGLGLDGIDFSRFVDGKELQSLRRLQRRLPVATGSTLALVRSRPEMVFAAAVPLSRPMPARRIQRRLARLGRRGGFTVTAPDRTHLEVKLATTALFVATERGRVILANDAAVLADVERGEGGAWVTAQVLDLSRRYPLVVSASVVPGRDGAPARRLDAPIVLALTLEPGLLRGVLALPLSIEELADIVRPQDPVTP